MRRTKEDAELTRHALLEAALQVFSQKGYDASRLEDVAEAAGVTRGAIYHHFGGKRELFAALAAEAEGASHAAIQRALSEGGSLLDSARRVLVYSLELLQTDSRYRRVTALYLFNARSSPELADFHRRHQADTQQQVEQVSGFFQAALAQGTLRAGLDPRVAAQAFLAYLNGLVVMWLLDPGFISIEKDAGALADAFIDGIAPRVGVAGPSQPGR